MNRPPMTTREAKRYVLERLATEIRLHVANGSEWLFLDVEGEAFDDRTQRHLVRALDDVADKLDRRARRLR